MNDVLFESLKLASDASAAAFKEGMTEGYRKGFRDGVAAVQKIVDEWVAQANKTEAEKAHD